MRKYDPEVHAPYPFCRLYLAEGRGTLIVDERSVRVIKFLGHRALVFKAVNAEGEWDGSLNIIHAELVERVVPLRENKKYGRLESVERR